MDWFLNYKIKIKGRAAILLENYDVIKELQFDHREIIRLKFIE